MNPSRPTRRSFLFGALSLATASSLPLTAFSHELGGNRSIRLFNPNTQERITLDYMRGGTLDVGALRRLNVFCRDWRTDDIEPIDPKLLDTLFRIQQKTGSDPIHVICGYRSPKTNAMLRRRSPAVAKNSLHMEGRALDIRVPGRRTAELRDIATAIHEGGVGYYPRSGFIHIDTGDVRSWTG